MTTNDQKHDDRRPVRRAKKRLAARQSAWDSLKGTQGRPRPGSGKIKTN